MRDGSFCTEEYPVAKARNKMQPIKSWALSSTCIDREGGAEMRDKEWD